MAKEKTAATPSPKPKEPSLVSVVLADGFFKDVVLYFNDKQVAFKDGKATVSEAFAKELRQGGYIK